jgi:hypothetical protein
VREVSRAIRVWLAWWVVLFLLWLVYVGEWNPIEWIAAASAAAVAATAAAAVQAQGLLRFRPDLGSLAGLRRVPLQVFVDFGILVGAFVRTLVRRRPVRGRFVTRPLRDADASSSFRRAVLTATATYSPNAYVVNINVERGEALLHDLVTHRSSEDPL